MISVNNFKNTASFRRFPVDNRSAILLKFKTKIFENFFVLWYRNFLCPKKEDIFGLTSAFLLWKNVPKCPLFMKYKCIVHQIIVKGTKRETNFTGKNFQSERSYPQGNYHLHSFQIWKSLLQKWTRKGKKLHISFPRYILCNKYKSPGGGGVSGNRVIISEKIFYKRSKPYDYRSHQK